VFTQRDVEPHGELCFSYSGPPDVDDVTVSLSLLVIAVFTSRGVGQSALAIKFNGRSAKGRGLHSLSLWRIELYGHHVQMMSPCLFFALGRTIERRVVAVLYKVNSYSIT
jgi:hypothetical protein